MERRSNSPLISDGPIRAVIIEQHDPLVQALVVFHAVQQRVRHGARVGGHEDRRTRHIRAPERRTLDECIERMPHYERHELVHGVWRTTMTTDSWQPDAGFTVASTESPHTVAFFHAAYSAGDARMRERIRKLAELSITHPERRYDM